MTTLIHTPQEIAQQIKQWRREGLRIGFVPTMGALHAGHLSLIEIARQQAGRVVVSIFVNPLQFGPEEDFDHYPRHEARDAAKLSSMAVEVLYLPKAEAMYPPGYATSIHIEKLGDMLCGKMRPGHFDGVATVVAKLFMQVLPDIAVFGEKDYQQLQIIRRMTEDLHLPVQIISGATMREPDGLAMSSRNQYLTAEERKIAPKLQAKLQEVAARLQANPQQVTSVLEDARNALLKSGFSRVDYFELCDAETLEALTALDRPARLLAAAWLGKTRLIDNVGL